MKIWLNNKFHCVILKDNYFLAKTSTDFAYRCITFRMHIHADAFHESNSRQVWLVRSDHPQKQYRSHEEFRNVCNGSFFNPSSLDRLISITFLLSTRERHELSGTTNSSALLIFLWNKTREDATDNFDTLRNYTEKLKFTIFAKLLFNLGKSV